MSKIVVLAEKPSVGREIARVLNCRVNKKSYFEGEKYLVTWALGHLVTLADPEEYDQKYVQWSLDTLPIIPEKMKLVAIKKTTRQFAEVRQVLQRNDVSEIIIATDAGREGELVARWIIEKAGVKKPLKRLWISSQTDKAILDGFRHLKPGKAYENLYDAAVCRAEADWIVGLSVSRALTCKYNAQLSAGRVQSATLAMIVNREEQIRTFQPKTYYLVRAMGEKMTLQWRDQKNQERIYDPETVKKLLQKLRGHEGIVSGITEETKKKSAPALYDLTELQRDANRMFGYSAKQTLSIMQRLYESHKVLTYPRTDSRYLTHDIVATLPDRLKAVAQASYKPFAQQLLQTKITGHKGFVDDQKVSDHHAIIPTEERANLSAMSNEERKIYDLVVKRFLSVLLPPFVYLQTKVEVMINGERFGAQGKVIQAKGWKAIYDQAEDGEEEDIQDQVLPPLTKGARLKISEVTSKEAQTKPPSRFNEATLLSAMEQPQKYVTLDAVDAKILGETGGIGTVATRADIIEKLYHMFYMEKQGQELIPTSKGKQLISLVPQELKSPLMTAKWERQLDLISKGQENKGNFMANIKAYAKTLIQDIKLSTDQFVHDNLTRTKCPECGKFLLKVKGKKGEMMVCQDRACGYRQSVAIVSNARCPECHKKMKIFGEGEGKLFTCVCGYREKLSSFQKRKTDKKGTMQKREVSQYLKTQKQESFVNNAFADAWAKLQK